MTIILNASYMVPLLSSQHLCQGGGIFTVPILWISKLKVREVGNCLEMMQLESDGAGKWCSDYL